MARLKKKMRKTLTSEMRKLKKDLEDDSYFDEDCDISWVSRKWRKKNGKHNCVLPVGQQGDCGCCYAFAIYDAASALHACRGGKLYSLSKQECVDFIHYLYKHAVDPLWRHGCAGANLQQTFEMLKQFGAYNENCYPYEGLRPDTLPDFCPVTLQFIPKVPELPKSVKQGKQPKKKLFISDYVMFSEIPRSVMSHRAIRTLRRQLIVGTLVWNDEFRTFKGKGTFRYKDGDHVIGDGYKIHGVKAPAAYHEVLIVGHGFDRAGVEFFLIKNSWGRKWGHKGFAKVERSCFVDISYPTGETKRKPVKVAL